MTILSKCHFLSQYITARLFHYWMHIIFTNIIFKKEFLILWILFWSMHAYINYVHKLTWKNAFGCGQFFCSFPPWDSSRLLVCYRAHFSVPETVESICVAICLRSNHKMTGLLLVEHLLVHFMETWLPCSVWSFKPCFCKWDFQSDLSFGLTLEPLQKRTNWRHYALVNNVAGGDSIHWGSE